VKPCQIPLPRREKITAPKLRVAAVVDRSGDVQAAARDCVAARFGFGGASPYAPDVVLVNEYRVKDFSAAVAEAGLRYLSQSMTETSRQREPKIARNPEFTKALGDSGRTLVSGERGEIVLLQDRTSNVFAGKVDSPTLLVLSISSMDDAIDFLNSSGLPLLANYVYAAPAACKYISQFVKSAISFANHIPTELLVGGPAPTGFAPSLHPRYGPEMFSISNPVFVNKSTYSKTLGKSVSLGVTTRERKQLEAALETSLTPVKEPYGPSLGFFEQGFLVNAGIILSTIIVGGVFGVKYGLQSFASLQHT